MSTQSILSGLVFLCASMAGPVVAQSAPAPGGANWKLLDRVETIINEEIVTLRELDREIVQRRKDGQITKESDVDVAKSDILRRSISERLAAQAGQDLGLDAQLVKRSVDDYLDREKARLGAAGLAEKLQQRELSAGEYRQHIERLWYSQVWEEVVTGKGESPTTKRVCVDRYVRPGRIRFEYERAAPRPEMLPLLGGSPRTVVLQRLIVDPEAVGGDVQAARKLAAQLRERILEGEDMGELNQRHGAEKQRFQLEPLEEARISLFEPKLGGFVADAEPGDVSSVMPYTHRNREAWQIVRLAARDEAQVPALESLAVQRKVAQEVEDAHEAFRREAALFELYRASYVWPPEKPEAPRSQAAK